MEWRKTRISRWTAGDYRITESPESTDGPFRLEGPAEYPEFFPTLEAAKATANTQNELAITRAENASLREQLAQARGIMPNGTMQVTAMRQPPPSFNGRGIPSAADRMTAAAFAQDANAWPDEDTP